jgi:Sigma-70, region 4.
MPRDWAKLDNGRKVPELVELAVLARYEGLTLPQIAKRCNRSVQTIHNWFRKAEARGWKRPRSPHSTHKETP